MISEAKHEASKGTGLRILTVINSENLLNEIK